MATISPPPVPPNPAVVDSERYIDQQIGRTRRALKLIDFSAGVITLAIGLLAYVLVAALLDHWVVPGGLGSVGRAVMFALLIAAGGWYFWRQFLPLFRPINPVYAAQTIERGSPSLKNSLLNLVLFRSHRQQMSARVYHALEQQTAERLSTASHDAAVDHSALLRLGYALLAVVAASALYGVLSPKDLAASAGRVLAPWSNIAPPSRVQILDVTPGEASVARGERLAVSAEVHGLRDDEPVRLVYSTADEQLVEETLPMTRAEGSVRFEGQLPRGAEAKGVVGVQQNLSYWIEAGDARSPRFAVTVFSRPTLVVQRVHYEYPAYTGFASKDVDNTGDVRGLEGARVTISALANQPIQSAHVDFDADGGKDLKMTVDGDRAVASFTLALRDDRRTPEHASYLLRMTTTSGRTNSDPAKYLIDVTPDYPPEVAITTPEEPELTVRVDEIVPIGVEARDPDFALQSVKLLGRAGDREVDVAEVLSDRHEGPFSAIKPFTPADAKLKAGDVLEYWAEAEDNRRPEAHVAFSERRRLRIVGPAEQGAPADGQRPPQGAPQAGDQQDDGEPQDGQGGNAGGAGQQGGSEDDAAKGEGQQGAGGGQGNDAQPGNAPPQAEGGENAGAGESEQQGSNQSPPGGGGQGAEPSGDSKSPENSTSAGAQPQTGDAGDEGQQDEGGQPEKVSSAGDNDGEAFERIAEHLANEGQDGGNAGDSKPGQQPSDPGESQAQSPSDASGEQANQQQPSGEGPDGARPTGESGERAGSPEQQPAAGSELNDGPQQAPGDVEQQGGTAGEQSDARPGADVPREAKPGDQQSQDQAGEESPSPDSAMNRNNGDPGAGGADEKEGSASDGSFKKARDKEPMDNRERMSDEIPPGGTNDKQESNSTGGQSGENAGGGQEGSGQRADAEGKGDAGENTAADEGAGQASEQGRGDAGDSAGADELADGQTGESSGDKPGEGSQQGRPGESASTKPGGSASGPQPGADAGEDPASEGAQPPQPEGQGPNEGATGGEQSAGDAAGQPGESGEQAEASPAESDASEDPPKPQPDAQGAATGLPQGAGQGAAEAGSQPTGETRGADEANLDFARKQTDLVLERLDDQLAKNKVDPELLKSLGWSREELRQFVDRWKNLKAQAADPAADASRELDDALRSLGLRRTGPERYRASGQADDVRDLNEAIRKSAPQEYAERVRNYNKGVSSGPKK